MRATLTNAQAALRWLSAERLDLDEVRQALNRIVRDANRAADVVGRVRALFKKTPPRNDRVEINATIREVIEFARSEAVKRGVAVRTELAVDLPLVQGDRVELQQVVLNLVLNAIEAMNGVEGPRDLLIATGTTKSCEVLVAVADSGLGSRRQFRRSCSIPSRRRSQTVWASGSRSAGQSSSCTGPSVGERQ